MPQWIPNNTILLNRIESERQRLRATRGVGHLRPARDRDRGGSQWWQWPLRGLEYALMPFTFTGETAYQAEKQPPTMGMEVMPSKPWALLGTPGLEEAQKVWDPRLKEYLPGGRLHEEYRELPWQRQLKYEAPAWAAAALVPGARWGRAALAPTAARPGAVGVVAQLGRIALAPPAAAEVAISAGLKYGIAIPAKYVILKPAQAGLKKTLDIALNTGLDRWLVLQGQRAEFANPIIRRFLELNDRKFYQLAQEHLLKRIKVKGTTPTQAAQEAAEATIKEMEPLLLKAVGDIRAKPPKVTIPPEAKPILPEAMATSEQKIYAHNIAQEKLLITEAGKMKPQYRRLALAMTGKRSMLKMTEAEAARFTEALERLEVKGGKPPKIPITTGLITKEFADQIPLLQEISAIERVRPTRQVFEKIGLGEEVFWSALEKEALFGADYAALETQVWNLGRGVTTERRQAIFRALENPDEGIMLVPDERDKLVWLQRYFDDWADKLRIPAEKRRQNYVTHIFERAIENDIVAKNPLDAELVRAMDFITPKTVFNPYLQKRLGATVGLREDPFAAALAYGRKAYRQYHYEPLIRKIRAYLPYLPPTSARYLRGYILRITGRPLNIDREMNQALRDFAKSIEKLPLGKKLAENLTRGDVAGLIAYNYASLLYFAWLGFKPTSAIRNLSQHSLILAEVGPVNFYKGMRLRFIPEGKQALKESVVLKSRARAYVPGIDESFASRWTDKTREVALKMFRAADRQNVSDAFLSGYAEAKSLGLPREWCIKRADEVAADTQYVYTRLGGAEWSQSSLGRILAPLTTWPENWVELMTKWIRARPSYVYQRYEKATGEKVGAQTNWLLRRKAILLYLAIVGSAYAVQAQTRLKATEYTGWTSLRYLIDIARGELPALDIPAAVAQVIGGTLLGDMTMVKSGWNRIRPDRLMGIVRQIERVIQGKADWMSLFIYMNPEKKEEGGKLLPQRGGGKLHPRR